MGEGHGVVASTEEIEGKRIVEVLGLVSGGASYVGGVGVALNEAVEGMKRAAEQQGANAIVGVRVTTASRDMHFYETLAYGTAVVVQGKHFP